MIAKYSFLLILVESKQIIHKICEINDFISEIYIWIRGPIREICDYIREICDYIREIRDYIRKIRGPIFSIIRG